MITFLLTALLGVMLLGIPILISIALIGFVGMALLPEVVMALFAQKMFAQLDSFTLLAMPYFILAGSIMTAGASASSLSILPGRWSGTSAPGSPTPRSSAAWSCPECPAPRPRMLRRSLRF